jgi:hypothetical protein
MICYNIARASLSSKDFRNIVVIGNRLDAQLEHPRVHDSVVRGFRPIQGDRGSILQ